MRTLFSTLVFSVIAALGAVGVGYTEQVMFISPLRVELKPTEDVAVVTVTNKSDKVKYYQVLLSDQAMVSDTTTVEVESFPYSAKKMVRFMPRRFDLQPGQRRVIRVMVRRPADLADGDYHTHMLFEEDTEARKAVASAAASGTVPEGSIKFQVEAVYSAAIPVVVQHGSVSSSIQLTNVTYNATAAQGKPALVAAFKRLGNAESGGFLTATIDGDPVIDRRRLRLYRETDDYSVVFPLDTAKLKPGKVVQIRLADSFSADATVLGQASVQLP
jgi:hypothetical protein